MKPLYFEALIIRIPVYFKLIGHFKMVLDTCIVIVTSSTVERSRVCEVVVILKNHDTFI